MIGVSDENGFAVRNFLIEVGIDNGHASLYENVSQDLEIRLQDFRCYLLGAIHLQWVFVDGAKVVTRQKPVVPPSRKCIARDRLRPVVGIASFAVVAAVVENTRRNIEPDLRGCGDCNP